MVETITIIVHENENKEELEITLDSIKSIKERNVKIVVTNTEKALLLSGIQTTFASYVEAGHVFPPHTFRKMKMMLENKQNIDVINFTYKNEEKQKDGIEIVDLNKHPEKIPILFCNTIIRVEQAKKTGVNKELGINAGKDLLYRMLIQNPQILECIICNEQFYIRNSEVSNRANIKEEWYIPTIKNYCIELASILKSSKKEVPEYIQYGFLHMIKRRFIANLNTGNKHVIDDRLDEFLEGTAALLEQISDRLILDYVEDSSACLSKELSLIFLKMKYKKKYAPHIVMGKKDAFLCHLDQVLLNLSKQKMRIDTMNYEKEQLVIESSLFGFIPKEQFQIRTKVGSRQVAIEKTNRFSCTKFFGKELTKRHTYKIIIPKNLISDKAKLTVTLLFGKFKVDMGLESSRFPARIDMRWRKSYWTFSNFVVSVKEDKLCFELKNRRKSVYYEARKLLNCARQKPKMLIARMAYWLTYPILHKQNIWITFDKFYKGGDNGEYFYKFVSRQKSDIKIKYIINKDYPDAKRLKREGYKVIYYGGFFHKIYFLHSKIVATTHANIPVFSGFVPQNFAWVQDLFRGEVVCIQHGLTVQNLDYNLNQQYDNLKRFYCASKYEIENLSKSSYGYYNKSNLRLTGVPRYDGLVKSTKKQILITPTWRAYISMPSSIGNTRPYSEDFKNTLYYKTYNNLINNSELIACANKYGYKITYLLHPVITSQEKDFTINANVEILSPLHVNYETLLRDASIMVTDYSGVQFDFAYMKKPVLYYHPPELPPHYEEGGFFYETMGFGEICKSMEAMVKCLCDYMKNDCELSNKYMSRIEDFFEYSDMNNCQRIYEDLLQYQKQSSVGE